jgi:hypothetical protein
MESLAPHFLSGIIVFIALIALGVIGGHLLFDALKNHFSTEITLLEMNIVRKLKTLEDKINPPADMEKLEDTKE